MVRSFNKSQGKSILVVDDTPDNLTLMNNLLKDLYQVRVANNGLRALEIAANSTPPDLILLDIMMPDMDGYEVCRRLKTDPHTKEIPVIFLTAKASIQDEEKGLQTGAVDYITKPISPPIVLARVKTHLTLKESADFLRNQNSLLEQEVAKRTAEIRAIQDVTILAMTSLAETRDTDTGNHIERTKYYVKALACKLQKNPRYSDYLTDSFIEDLVKAAPLHDIGKVGIPDHILLKPGHLSPDEFEIMKNHTLIGKQAIEKAELKLGLKLDFLKLAKEMIYCHQEKWDGTGYPEGLSQNAIPLSARLMALADVYDALTTKRVYKTAIPHEEAAAIIISEKGCHFDPDLVDVFEEIQDQFKEIAAQYIDLCDEV